MFASYKMILWCFYLCWWSSWMMNFLWWTIDYVAYWWNGVGAINLLMKNLGQENDVVKTWSYATTTSVEWYLETWHIEEWCYIVLSYDYYHLWCYDYIPGHRLLILKLHYSILELMMSCCWHMFMVQIIYGVGQLVMTIMVFLSYFVLVINVLSIIWCKIHVKIDDVLIVKFSHVWIIEVKSFWTCDVICHPNVFGNLM